MSFNEKSTLLSHEETGCWEKIRPLTGVRIPVLLSICLLSFGNYFMTEVPGSLGWGVECQAEEPSVACYNSPQFNFLGTPNVKFCEPFSDHKNEPVGMCQVSYDEDMFTSTTVAGCMADCWRTNPGFSVFGLQVVDRDNTFTSCFCAEDFPSGHDQQKVSAGNCSAVCNGLRVLPNDPKLTDHCGSLLHMTSGRYTCNEQTVEMHFRTAGKTYTNTENLSIYSIYSYTTVALAMGCGVVVDKLGVRRATVLFAILTLIGQVLFAIGVQFRTYWLMAASQVIWGMGGDALVVSQTTYIVRWFEPTGFVAFAMGITVSFSRVGSSAAFAVMPVIANRWDVVTAIWIGVGTQVISALVSVTLYVFDYWAEKKGRDDLITLTVNSETPFQFSDLKLLNVEILLCTLVTVAFYAAIFPWNGIAKNFFNSKWLITMVEAGTVVSVYTFFSAAISPVVGYAVDRTGRALAIILFGIMLSPVVHTLLWLVEPDVGNIVVPVLLMMFIGFVLTLGACTIWPSVPYIIDNRVLGTAYGLMLAVQNLGLALIPMLIGYIRDATKYEGLQSYYYCSWVFMGCGGLAFVFCMLWIFYHWRWGNRALFANAKERTRIWQETRAQKPLGMSFDEFSKDSW